MARPAESAAGLCGDYLSSQIVHARYFDCDVGGRVSGHIRLVLSPSTMTDHENRNLKTFREVVDTVEDRADCILYKIQGVAYGTGV